MTKGGWTIEANLEPNRFIRASRLRWHWGRSVVEAGTAEGDAEGADAGWADRSSEPLDESERAAVGAANSYEMPTISTGPKTRVSARTMMPTTSFDAQRPMAG